MSFKKRVRPFGFTLVAIQYNKIVTNALIRLPPRPLDPTDDPQIFEAIGQSDLLLHEGSAIWTFAAGQHTQRNARLIYDGTLRVEADSEEGIPPNLIQHSSMSAPKLHVEPFLEVEVDMFNHHKAKLAQIKMPTIDIQRLQFFLINCTNTPKSAWDIGDWRFEIAPTNNEFHPIARFSHIGSLNRRDGKPFDADSSDEVMEAIGWGLSLATGRIVFPTLKRGFDAEQRLVWMDFSSTRYEVARVRDLPTWLPRSTPHQQLISGEVMIGLYAKLSDQTWGDALRLAIDFYCDALGHNLTEASRLILIQAGLEKLVVAWQTIKGVMPNGKSFPTNEFGMRLSMMLAEYGIAVTLPVELADLAALLSKDLKDAPRVVANVRNKYTHAITSAVTEKHESQARQLSQRYLELVLLKILGATQPILNTLHHGSFSERLEKLPWVV